MDEVNSTDPPLNGEYENPNAFTRPRRRRAVPMPQIADRLPPHSLESEQGVLGCILLAPNESMGMCIEKLNRGADVFYDMRHAALFNALVEMYDRKELIDPITVQQRLRDRNQLEALGGMPYIAGLMNAVPSAASLEYYLEIVKEKFTLRSIIQTCTGIVAKVYDHQGDVQSLLDDFERDAMRISQDRVQVSTKEIRAIVQDSINVIEEYWQRAGMVSGIATGYPDFDKMTGGLKGGDMIVIAARPSLGKTSLAMNIAEFVACEDKLPVGIFSLEMTAESLVTRMICSRARVNLRNVRDGFLAERDFPRLTGAAGRIANAPIYIDDTSGLSILQLRAKARRMQQQYGIKLFVIDYLQLMHSSSSKADNRQQEIADISCGIKGLAKELNVPVIVLAQLNRDIEREKNRKPRLSDLRESGAIEQDADLVGLLYNAAREEDEDQEPNEVEAVPVNLLIAKQRNGPTGDVNLTFLKSYTRFESASKVSGVDYEEGSRKPYND